MLPNPIHETNDRLEELEDRLKTMTMIMEEGVKIATSLQEVGFENAKSAIENAKTAKRTIWLTAVATLASIIALVMPLVSAKENERQQAAIIAQVTLEFEKLRNSDQTNSQQVAKALEETQKAIVVAVQKQNSSKNLPSSEKK